MEWYDPEQVTTEGGSLKITLDERPNHGLDYMGGMMSTWNKFCFTGGIIVTSVVLPGRSDVYGLWPAVWTMGNLGRAGYGASLDGMWPYVSNLNGETGCKLIKLLVLRSLRRWNSGQSNTRWSTRSCFD